MRPFGVVWTENRRTMPYLAPLTRSEGQNVVAADAFRLPPTLASHMTYIAASVVVMVYTSPPGIRQMRVGRSYQKEATERMIHRLCISYVATLIFDIILDRNSV